jgi:hypothetical protein
VLKEMSKQSYRKGSEVKTNAIKGQGRREFSLIDTTGSFSLKREVSLNKKRKLLYESKVLDSKRETIEHIRSISELKLVKQGRVKKRLNRPVISQFSTWFDGKQYRSQIELKNNEINVLLSESFEGVPLKSTYSKEDGTRYCFFSLIPECLAFWGSLRKEQQIVNRGFNFNIIWESFPFNKRIYSRPPSSITTQASIKYEGFAENKHIYILNLEDQEISFHFDEKKTFLGYFWVSEGLSVAKK